MKINIRTRTPIWTGDINGKCKEIKETGIIGSLRWWYRFVARAYGKEVCDLNSDNIQCPQKKNNKEHRCDVCELFGCTDWRRKFKLICSSENFSQIPSGLRMNAAYSSTSKRTIKGIMGDFTFDFYTIRRISDEEWYLLNKTLNLISDFGSLGAYSAQGDGVVTITKDIPTSLKTNLLSKAENNFFFWKITLIFKESIKTCIHKEVFQRRGLDKKNWLDLWSLVNNNNESIAFLPLAPLFRDALRSEMRPGKIFTSFSKERATGIRHELMGYVESSEKRRNEDLKNDVDKSFKKPKFYKVGDSAKTRGSKIAITHGYKIDEKTVQIRIFGHFPEITIQELKQYDTHSKTQKPIYRSIEKPELELKENLSNYVASINQKINEKEFWERDEILNKGEYLEAFIVEHISLKDILESRKL